MHDPYEQIDPYAAKLIRFKSHQACQQFGFPADRWVDIRDELWAHLLQQLQRFDSAKAKRNTFVARVVERKLIDIVRYYMAKMRSPGREECSLNDTVLDCDGRPVDRHQVIPEASNVPQRLQELERDVADVLGRMSALHRTIALGLVTGTVNAIANELDMPRSAVERHIAEMRQVLEDAGLREYL